MQWNYSQRLLTALTHLIVNNNQLTELSLQNTGNLQELDCSNNPPINLNLTYPPHLTSFDCLDIRFDKSATATITASPTSAVETVFNNNSALTMGLGIPLGVSILGWLALGSFFCYKKWGRRANGQNTFPLLRIPGSH